MSIFHSIEAILLPSDNSIELGSYVINTFFYLARALLIRSLRFKQPGDVKHAVEYLRYLQDQSLETPNVTRSLIKSRLVLALGVQVELESVDPMQDIGELATLCRELLISCDSEPLLVLATKQFVTVMRRTREPVMRLPHEVIECLREARIRLPNLEGVYFALAHSLYLRFGLAHSHDDYKEAMLILDEVIADPNESVERTMRLAGAFALGRFCFDSKPEHLAEAIFRSRAHLNAMSFEDPHRYLFAESLGFLEKHRFEDFGVRSNWQQDNTNVVNASHLAASQMANSNLVEFPLPMPDRRNPAPHINAIFSIFKLTDLSNIEKAVEYCRLCLTSPHSYLPLTYEALGRLLYRLFSLTNNIEYLNESITVYCGLIKMPGVPTDFHNINISLIVTLHCRLKLFKAGGDINEIRELSTAVATDMSTEVLLRFHISCAWASAARYFGQPSTLNAYETAISLMQESLYFAPTLEMQHSRLAAMRDPFQKLPLDYVSYLVEIGEPREGPPMVRDEGLPCFS